MYKVESKPWPRIIQFYRSFAETPQNRWLRPMLEFVERVGAADFAQKLYGSTSILQLRISYLPEFDPDKDLNNVLVLTIFAVCMVALIVGYFVAWRSKRTVYRRAGSLMTAVVAGFAGLFMSMWLIGAVMPFPPPDGTSLWAPLAFLVVFSPLPLGAFYICAKFIRQASQQD